MNKLVPNLEGRHIHKMLEARIGKIESCFADNKAFNFVIDSYLLVVLILMGLYLSAEISYFILYTKKHYNESCYSHQNHE